jgi:hypothetical protein
MVNEGKLKTGTEIAAIVSSAKPTTFFTINYSQIIVNDISLTNA